ncbi:MAG: hemerythrin domain-containing protein [Planctomycetota bacterium]
MTAMEAVDRPTTAAAPETRCCGHHQAFEILHDCHEHILERLARLETMARALQREGLFAERHLAVLGDVLSFLHVAVPMHSTDEERTLFPRLRAALGRAPQGSTPMDCLEQEHVQHQALLVALERAVVRRDLVAVGRAALDLVAEYRTHIAKEEEVLFPWARTVLTDQRVVEEMTREMRERRVAAGLSSC